MKQPIRGKTYRLVGKRQWGLHRENDPRGGPSVHILEGETITCIEGEFSVKETYPKKVRMPNEKGISEPGDPLTFERFKRFWLYKTLVVYESPIEAQHNNGHEDNIMNYLVELQ